MKAEDYVCPNEECNNPIDLKKLNLLPDELLVVCPNCNEVKFFKDAKGEVTCDWYDKRVDKEFLIPFEELSKIPAKVDAISDDEEEDRDVDDSDEDEYEEEELSEVDKALMPESDLKKIERKRRRKRKKKKKKAYPHIQLVKEYLDYFLGHPEGVETKDLEKVFGVDVQQAHYIQRTTFKLAKEHGYEVEKKRVTGGAKKLLFIRNKDC